MGRRKPLNRTGGHLSGAFGCKHVVGGGSPRVAIRDGKKYCLSTACTTQQLDITAEPAAAKPTAGSCDRRERIVHTRLSRGRATRTVRLEAPSVEASGGGRAYLGGRQAPKLAKDQARDAGREMAL